MNFLSFILVIVVLFISAVVMVALLKKCSVKEATIICKQYIGQILEALSQTSSEPITYPTFVGWVDGRVIAQSVNEEFAKLRANFSVCFFDICKYFAENNCIAYRFKIKRKIDSLSDEDLQDLLQKQAEEVVTQNMQMYDFYLNPEPLTVIDLRQNDLIIAYAVTPDGVNQIDSIKRQIRTRQFHKAMKPASKDSLTEEWHEE